MDPGMGRTHDEEEKKDKTKKLAKSELKKGDGRNRTAVEGFAVLCLAPRPHRLNELPYRWNQSLGQEKSFL